MPVLIHDKHKRIKKYARRLIRKRITADMTVEEAASVRAQCMQEAADRVSEEERLFECIRVAFVARCSAQVAAALVAQLVRLRFSQAGLLDLSNKVVTWPDHMAEHDLAVAVYKHVESPDHRYWACLTPEEQEGLIVSLDKHGTALQRKLSFIQRKKKQRCEQPDDVVGQSCP